MFPQFTIIDNLRHKARRFDNALQVSIWMLGRNPDDYTIIKSKEIKIPEHGREIGNIQRFLENV